MAITDGFVQAILDAPAGTALLSRIESLVPEQNRYGRLPLDSDPGRVAEAAALIADMPFGEFVELAVYVALIDVGPWISEAPERLAVSYRDAAQRAPIAEAIKQRFGEALHAPIDCGNQQWWTMAGMRIDRLAPLFRDFEDVYGAGQFTSAGLWTASEPPKEAQNQVLAAWEIEVEPISRWHLPISADVRVFEIHRPADWKQLVVEHPAEASPYHDGWELPGGLNQRPIGVLDLVEVRSQRGARRDIRAQLVPDWRSVANSFDGVHLSWAGFITAEGCITDFASGDVTMLRYWMSERTLWLSDVFGEPEPLPAPDSEIGRMNGADVRSDAQRRDSDAKALRKLLGRD